MAILSQWYLGDRQEELDWYDQYESRLSNKIVLAMGSQTVPHSRVTLPPDEHREQLFPRSHMAALSRRLPDWLPRIKLQWQTEKGDALPGLVQLQIGTSCATITLVDASGHQLRCDGIAHALYAEGFVRTLSIVALRALPQMPLLAVGTKLDGSYKELPGTELFEKLTRAIYKESPVSAFAQRIRLYGGPSGQLHEAAEAMTAYILGFRYQKPCVEPATRDRLPIRMENLLFDILLSDDLVGASADQNILF